MHRRVRGGGLARALCLLCAACGLGVLLAHNYPRVSARETGDTLRRSSHELVLLSTGSSTLLLDERHLRWSKTAALWGARGQLLGVQREWGGHGMKLNLLRERLREMVEGGRGEQLVMYTDSRDVMFSGSLHALVRRFEGLVEARVLFAAEVKCWPDEELALRYPRPHPDPVYPYLNAGAFIGYASTLLELTSLRAVRDHEDDQLYYSHAYLNTSVRERLRIRIDHRAEIFQCLVNATGDVRVVSVPGAWAHVENTATGTRPLVLHANGPVKENLWELERALVRSWTSRPDLAPRGVADTTLEKELPELAELYGLTRDDDIGDAGDY